MDRKIGNADVGMTWNSAKVAEGLETTQAARAEALTFLKDILDEYHGIPRPESYYELIAGNWLDIFIHLTYVSWQSVLPEEVPHKAYPIQVTGDLLAFIHSTLNPQAHTYWQATVARALKGESPAEWHFEQEKADISNGGKDWRKKILASVLGSNRPDVIFCNPYVKCSPLEWLSALWRWRRWAKWDDFDYPVNFTCHINQNWRRARSTDEMPPRSFPSLLRILLPLHIPVALLEGFALYREAVLGLKLWRPRVLYTAVALHSHLTFKILAAEWRMEGTKLLNHQHGGGYGVDRIHILEDYESRVVDQFYSWGWQRSGRSVRPMSAPYPARHHGTRHRVLLMCCAFPATAYRLHFHPMPGTIETMEENTAAFLSSLPANNDLMIRLTLSHDGIKLKPLLQMAAPWSIFDEGRTNVFKRYAESRLVVHNYLGTSWLETLAMDIPTVCFFDPNTYAFRLEAQPYIDAMERVGILHRSGPDAARFVAGVMADPLDWWRKPEVQEARQSFVHNYANFSESWAEQWETEFRKWLE